MKLMKLTIFVCLLLFGVALAAQNDNASDLEIALSELSESAGRAYVAPVVNAFGADFNSGWFTRAPRSKLFGVDVAFKIVGMSAMFSKDDETFSVKGSFHLTEIQANQILDTVTWDQYGPYADAYRTDLMNQLLETEYQVGIHGPTIIGSGDDEIMVTFYEQDFQVGLDDQVIHVDDIDLGTGATGIMEDFNAFPLFAPQMTLGTIQGTNLIIRYLPNFNISEMGELTYWGIGVQHNPIVWLGPILDFVIPVDVSLQFSTQRMDVGDMISASSWNFGVNASKSIGLKFLNIAPYACLLVEGANLAFKYDYEYDIVIDEETGDTETIEDTIKFDLKSENQTRLVMGVAARLGVFELNFDYNVSKVNAISWGAGLGFTF